LEERRLVLEHGAVAGGGEGLDPGPGPDERERERQIDASLPAGALAVHEPLPQRRRLGLLHPGPDVLADVLHRREHIRPGMKESQAAALWQGFVHGEGTGWKGRVDLALAFSLVWSGPGIKTFTATGDGPVLEDEPTLFE